MLLYKILFSSLFGAGASSSIGTIIYLVSLSKIPEINEHEMDLFNVDNSSKINDSSPEKSNVNLSEIDNYLKNSNQFSSSLKNNEKLLQENSSDNEFNKIKEPIELSNVSENLQNNANVSHISNNSANNVNVSRQNNSNTNKSSTKNQKPID